LILTQTAIYQQASISYYTPIGQDRVSSQCVPLLMLLLKMVLVLQVT
jgi:hypothetical protein